MPLATRLLSVAAVLATAIAAQCPKGLSFWDTNEQHCTQCTECAPNELVLLPCQPYKDTICGPISALNWGWMQPPKVPIPATTRPPKKVRPGARKVTLPPPASSPPPPASLFSTPSPPASTLSSSTEAATTEVAVAETETAATTTEAVARTQSSSEAPTTKVSAQPFLAQETSLEWDWQALTLAATIATFVVLLVVFAVYAAVHARRATVHRRRLQQELDAAQLSLFATAVNGEDAEMQTLSSPPPKGMYNANQCLYLEKLLEQKQSRRANIYVETGRQATPAPARRSSRWKSKQYPLRTP